MKKQIAVLLCAAMLVVSVLSGCSTPPAAPSGQAGYKAGSYEAEADGHGGKVKVTVVVSETAITDVTVDASSETAGLGDKAAAEIGAQIVAKQSLGIDAVSGATITSNAVLAAAELGLIKAGGNIEALKQAAPKENDGVVKEISTDVVVIGAGGSGFAAAVTSAEAGAKVVLLEKTAIPGGTTANGGGFFAADSQLARDLDHAPLDINMIFEKYMDEMDWLADAYMVRQFLETSTATADWLSSHGVKIHKMENAVQQTHAEGTNGYHKYDDHTKTSSYFKAALDKIENIDQHYETRATELITNEAGEVTGVVASAKDGSTLKITAKSVVIATGGFVGNDEMISKALNGVKVNAAGYNSNVGDGINMALELGAATRSMSAMTTHTMKVEGSSNITGEYDPMDKMYASASIAYIPVNVWLNQDGVRIANEDIVYDRMLTGHALTHTGGYGWFLYNQKLLDTLEEKGAAATGMYDRIAMGPFAEYTPMNQGWKHLNQIVSEMEDGKTVIKANTLEELAEKTGINLENLKKTMERYNADAKAGKDTLFGKRGAHMWDMSEGPYIVMKVTPNNLGTAGGLRINSTMHVVKNDPADGYTPIANLFAAGSDASALYSDHYAHTIEGTAQGWAYASGRLAAKYAVKNALGIEVDLFK